MKANLGVLMAGAGLLLVAIPALAHHSFAAEYDASKKVTLEGKVTKIEWMNPHIWIYMDAKDAAGKVEHWQCEGGAPNALTRQGWTKNALKAGDEVTIVGARAKDATNTCSSRTIKLPDGRRLFAGSPDDGGPGARKAQNQ